MSDAPHTPAAFINAIAEEGSKKEAVEWLQKTWNERCHLERENEALRKDAERYRWLRQMDRCQPWNDLLMRPITRTEDIDAAIDAAIKEQS